MSLESDSARLCTSGQAGGGGGMSSVSCGNGKLRQWLIDQIDSNKYPGLVWENEEKSIFRIPWKHAGKQDYNRDEDAALFKAWALFKGKFREGIDKPDPPTWKTRLRCALNKSNDFEELVERSQLDISDPYKVYRLVPEGAKKGEVPSYRVPPDLNWREYVPDPSHPEISYQCTSASFAPRNHHWQGPACQSGCQVTGTFYTCPPPESQTPGIPMEPGIRSGEAVAFSDCRLHICLYYNETLVKEVTTASPEGCRISYGQSYENCKCLSTTDAHCRDSRLYCALERNFQIHKGRENKLQLVLSQYLRDSCTILHSKTLDIF
uniref:Interferon regulatory factor 4 n=1 Tax=Sphaerodactylus townsendi TaxID=933632 RepID=A0ACB8FCQ3_9SAUR